MLYRWGCNCKGSGKATPEVTPYNDKVLFQVSRKILRVSFPSVSKCYLQSRKCLNLVFFWHHVPADVNLDVQKK